MVDALECPPASYRRGKDAKGAYSVGYAHILTQDGPLWVRVLRNAQNGVGFSISPDRLEISQGRHHTKGFRPYEHP